MGLADEYRRQFRWRGWTAALDEVPAVRGRTVLDLGCGVGDLAAALAARGARVVGIDANEELLREARGRGIADAEFRVGDLRTFADPGTDADGVWSSFAAAYFPDLASVLPRWTARLRPGGWIALTEIDDLFGHGPLDPATRARFDSYADDAIAAGRYDFRMGRRLRGHLERCGFRVTRELALPDLEFSFDGPAAPEVLDAWRQRFERMKGLQVACGPDFARVRDEFLGCLTRPEHRSAATVRCCVAVKA